MKKFLCCVLALSLFTAPSAQVLDAADVGNIDTIMEDNALTEVANRYGAVQLSFFPEYATHLGFESANDRLDTRTPEHEAQAARALGIVQESLQAINYKNLSEAKKTEYHMLQGMLNMDTHNSKRQRYATDPRMYSAVFTAIYDLRTKALKYRESQDRDLTARLAQLPKTAEQTQNYLSTPPSFLAQLAMEDAYYAYLTIDNVFQYLQTHAQDDITRGQIRNDAKQTKAQIKKMFDIFKKLAQENTTQDFRLGEKDYNFVLTNRYFIDKPKNLLKQLNKNFQTAQQNLAKTLDVFALPEEDEDVVVEDIQVPGEEAIAAEGAEIIQPAPAPVKKAKKAKKKKNKKLQPVTAQDFYTVYNRLLSIPVQNRDFLTLLANEVNQLNKSYVESGFLPDANLTLAIREMPAYYAYTYGYLFLPPFGTQTNPSYDVYLRSPSGNATAKQEILNRDFNAFALKLLIAGKLIPGEAFRSVYSTPKLLPFRKMYHVPTLKNGWEVYAQHLAQEQGYIATDEELLFLAWDDYVRAAQALADYYLHTRQFTYSEALNWLTETNGFEKTQAENMLKQIAAEPGEAVSYIYGYDAIKNLRAKYQKKQGKKFKLADFHAKLLSLGDIPPAFLEAEMENAYVIEKNHVTQALNTPFYM